MVCVRYRPRQPRTSPVWQVLHDHAAKVPGLSSDAAAAKAPPPAKSPNLRIAARENSRWLLDIARIQ